MQVFSGAVGLRLIERPKGHEALEGFTCGRGLYEGHVDELVQNQFDGAAKHAARVLVMEDLEDGDSPTTMAVVGWRERRSPLVLRWSRHKEKYLHMIGVAADYRAQGLRGQLPIGRALLQEALRQIAREESLDGVPSAWGFVSPENSRSRRMASYEGFKYRGPEPQGGDAFVCRPPGLLLPPPMLSAPRTD